MASGAGARQRRSRAFEEGRRRGVPTRRPLLEAPSEDGGFQVQNFGNSSENGNCASKLTLDFEQRIRLRSQQKYKSYSPCKGMSKQISSPDWSQVRQLILDTSTGDMESKTLQEIEKALEVAKSNLESLKMTEEILGHLVTEIKQEEENIADVINNKFEDIAASLNSRKRKLQTELETNTWNYITDVRKVQVCVTQKRRSLDAAIKMARELRAKHSLKTCYNLSQVLSNLKITVEDEVSKVDNLKKRTLPRFYMDSEEIVLVHENIGKLSLEKPNVSHFGDCLLQSSNIEDNLQPTASPVCRKRRQFIEHIGSLVPGQVSDDCLQRSDIWCQEMNPLFIQKCSAGAPWADSTPDVIIEEIIEDNQEMCSAEYSEETHQKKGFKKRLLPFGPKADSVQLVFVSCVINPSHFYVQTLAQKKTAVCLEKTIRQFCRSNSSSPEDILELGTIIFVRSKEHGIWCRAKIIELIPVQNVNEGKPCGPTKYRICDIAKMQVFLIDFGHSEVLIVSGIANEVKANPEPISPDYIVTKDLCLVIKKPDLYMEAQLRGINKLTLQCSLKDIVPKHSSWSGAARTEFLKMINNKAVLMKVFREENGVLVVDLMKPPANKISSDMPVSLRDALVFMDLASFRTELPYQSESTVPLQYCPPVIPQVNTEVTVMVSYVNSPGDFYLQLCRTSLNFLAGEPHHLSEIVLRAFGACFGPVHVISWEIWAVIMSASGITLDLYLNKPDKELPQPSHFTYLLEQGPEYAAFLEKVKEVYTNEGGDNLEILYPIQGQPCVARFEDDGEWYRAQVIGLLDHQEVEVKYVDFGNISKINVKDMRKIKDDFLASPAKAIRCKLAYIEPFKGAKEWSIKSKHRLEELTRDKCMLCFVTEKSHDNILTVELYEHGRVLPHQCWNINILLVKEDLASYISSNPKVTNISHCEVWDPAPEEMFSLGSDVLRPENVDLSQIDLRFESNKELQVRISHIVSPSKIFVQFLTSEKYLQSIQKKMIASCYESENETIDWKIDMNCAAYVPDLNEWRRGQIRRIVSENNVEVFFLDFGEIKLMNTVSLRKLGDDLNSIKPLAVECSLTDLRPAGGTDEWTATACDRLVQYLTGTIVNIIVQESNSSPLPVKILSKDGGVNIDISERIIDEGLAFRKRPHKTDPNTQTPENPPEMHLKGENADTSNLSAETEDTQRPSVPEDKSDTCDTECKEQALLISVAPHRMAESYKPPFIPSTDHFSATVSYIADSGTIYVIPKSQEAKLKQLMDDIQNNFKCLGLLEPYCWTKGEACVVRAADTLWHRGQVIEIGGGIIRVQYIDLGYIEKIPQCHLYPTVLYADIPPFSIPCQLYKTIPVGGFWQEDAIELFQELLAKRLVEIHIMEQLDDPWGKLSVKLYFSGMSLSSFMAWHMHCVSEEDDGSIPTLDIANCTVEHLEENCEITYEELLLSEIDTPLLPDYISPSLPVLGAHFPVKVTHVQLPDKVYLALDQSEDSCQNGGIENGGMRLNSDFENLDEALKDCNENIHTYYPLTDFRTDMPCLAQYVDGMWYRGKLCSVKELNPLTILVKFVDYGESKKLTTDRLRQIPSHLMQYPIQAFKVQLAGFKPAVCDTGPERIPYCDKWSIDALWAMVDCLRGKRLFASSVMHSPEHTVFLYGDGQLVHLELVEKGFAELN